MDPLLEAIGFLLKKIGIKIFDEDHDQTQNFLIQHPLLLACLVVIPTIGPGIVYAIILQQNYKAAIFCLIDVPLLFLFPIYVFYKLAMAYDTYRLAERLRTAGKLGEWQFF